MLMVTLAAVEAILQLMHAEAANALRLHVGSRRFSRAPDFRVEAATLPEPDDIVLELEGARLYVDPETHENVYDQVLDADLTGDEPRFLLYAQPERTRTRPLNDEGPV
jgi:Fe-S cluster assembly iron-binding protein IscA